MLPIRTVLHPTDFSDRSWHALQLACALARDYKARLILLNVVPHAIIAYGEGVIPTDPEDLFREAHARLDAHADHCTDLVAERRVEEGDPATLILSVALEGHADVIVMGTHGRTGLRRLIMGSVAEEVVRHASCPVLTVTSPFPPAVPLAEVAEPVLATA